MKGIKIFLKKKRKKKRLCGCKIYKNLLEDENQRLAESRKKYKIWKNKTALQRKADLFSVSTLISLLKTF